MTTPLLVRPGTSDIAVFREVWIDHRLKVDVDMPAPRLILDLGAYTGLSTRWLSDRYRTAHMVAVEPNPESVELLRQNAPMAEVHECAIGCEPEGPGEPGPILHVSEDTGAYSANLFGSTGNGWATNVAASTVDEILDGRAADIVKMDIEGSEVEVFQAGGEWLKHVRAIFIEHHERKRKGCRDAVLKGLQATGRPHAWLPNGGSNAVVVFE